MSSSASSLSCSGLSRTSLSDSRASFLYVIPGQAQRDPGISWIPVSSTGMTVFFSSVIPELFPVMFGLEPDISFTDSRVKYGNDRGEETNTTMTILFFLMLDF